jgi:hypothetical protein
MAASVYAALDEDGKVKFAMTGSAFDCKALILILMQEEFCASNKPKREGE